MKPCKITQLTALLLILALPMVQAQEKGAVKLSLKEAQDYAAEHSFDMTSSFIDVQQARKDVNMQVSQGLPQIYAEGTAQQFLEIPTTLVPAEFFGGQPGEFAEVQFGTEYSVTGGLSGTQMIFDPMWIIGLKGSQTFLEFSQDKHKKTELEVRTTIEQTYYTVLVAQENKSILEKNLEHTEKTLNETKAMFDQGFAEESAVDQLQLTVSTIKNNIDQAGRQVEVTKKLLKYQMGMNMEQQIELTDNLESLWTVDNPQALIDQQFDPTKSINYKIANTQVTLHEYLVKLDKAKYLPTISAFMNYQQQALRDQFNFFESGQPWYPTTVWGVQLSLPVWDSFHKAAMLNKTKLELTKFEERLNSIEAGMKMQYERAKANYISAVEKKATEEENIKLAQKIYDKTLVKYNEGLATSMELTQAQNQLTAKQGSYINALFELLNAKSELNKVLTTY